MGARPLSVPIRFVPQELGLIRRPPWSCKNSRLNFQKQKRMEVHKTIFSPYVAALSHNIAKLLPDDLDYSFFCNSGAEAVEGAIKLAYKYHEGKRKVILH